MVIRKRVFAFFLAVFLSFGVCAVDYLKVEALEVGGGIVSWETACNFLFSLLGIAPSEKTMEEYVNWDEWRSAMAESSTQYFLDNLDVNDLPQGMTKEQAVQDWILSVCEGDLDKLSPCWDLYREWAKEQVVDGGSSSDMPTVSSHVALQSAGYTPEMLQQLYERIPDFEVSCGFYKYDGGTINCTLYGVNSYLELNGNGYSLLPDNNTIKSCDVSARYNNLYRANYNAEWHYQSNGIIPANHTYVFGSVNGVRDNTTYVDYVWDLSGSVSPSVPSYDSVVPVQNITNVDIINNYATTNTQDVVIDWSQIADKVGEMINTGVVDIGDTIDNALDEAMDKVTSMEWSVTNYNDYVTNISNTYAYDITNEQVITKPETTIPDVIEGNVAKSDFTLNGLQYVFPFCIPWDIRDFILILVAEPVAPVIEYPIYNPVTGQNEIITLDFSEWYTVTQIFRYIFDFLLIIGLLLLARSLIGAGGGD